MLSPYVGLRIFIGSLTYLRYNATINLSRLLGDTERMVSDVYSHILEEKEQVNESIEKAVLL